MVRARCPRCRALYRDPPPRCPRDGEALLPEGADPLVGEALAGRYIITRFVGEGAMGRVYEARHRDLDRRFAVKVMFGDLASADLMRARFAREARAASRLSHENVVGVVDYGEDDGGLPYLVMDFVEGRTLGDALRAHGPWRPEAVMPLARGLLAGLQHAHERGLVHRDLKPENVMLVPEGGVEVPKIVDFGIALMVDAAPEDRITHTGHIVGTPAYMAPEQAFGDVSPSVDLYALGGVLFAALTGRAPFEGEVTKVLLLKMTEEAPTLQDNLPAQPPPPALAELVRRLLAREPRQRPGSAAEALALLSPPPPTETTPSLEDASEPAELPAPPPLRRAGVWMAGAAAVLAVLATTWWLGRTAPRPAMSGRVVEAPSFEEEPTPPPIPTPAAEPEPAEALARPAESDPGPPAPGVDPAPAAPGPEAAPRVRSAAPRATRRAPRGTAAGAPPPPVTAPAPAPTPDPTGAPGDPRQTDAGRSLALFTAAYKRVGTKLGAAAPERAAPLRARYLKITFADALRVESVRQDAMAELQRIEQALDAP